jgi:ferredoxin-type protein NapH
MMPEEQKNQPWLRQRIRKALIILSFALYPVTFAYISCPIITEGASLGIITGGLIVFGLLFISSLFIGRLWCGYLCPSGGLQEIYSLIHDRRLWTRKMDWLKYLVFLGIFGSLGFAIWSAGGLTSVDHLYGTGNGISIAGAGGVAAFLGPVIIVTLFALVFGRRGFCHTFCPIAVMLMIGRKIRNLVCWPALHLEADDDKCIDCKQCSRKCPMSLDVNAMVRKNEMENTECLLCANCADVCPQGAIQYSWKGR